MKKKYKKAKELKLLKDYLLNQWMEAAGECQFCRAPYEARVTWVDETGSFGDVETRIHHNKDCIERYDDEGINPPDEDVWAGTDIAGWEFHPEKQVIAGKEYSVFSKTANIAPCLACWRLVVDVPLILWPEDGGWEAHFCWNCVKELGLDKALIGHKVR
jgi:hypothetical protein